MWVHTLIKEMVYSLRLCLCRVWTRPVSLQLSVTSSAASSSPTSCPLLLERRLKRSRGGVAEGLGPLKARPGARSQGLSCGTWSARMLLKHTTSLTAWGEDTVFFCLSLSHICWLCNSSENNCRLSLWQLRSKPPGGALRPPEALFA